MEIIGPMAAAIAANAKAAKDTAAAKDATEKVADDMTDAKAVAVAVRADD